MDNAECRLPLWNMGRGDKRYGFKRVKAAFRDFDEGQQDKGGSGKFTVGNIEF